MTPKDRKALVKWLARYDWGPGIELSQGDLDEWEDFLTALEASGLAVVPVEPTRGMKRVGRPKFHTHPGSNWETGMYRAMLAASPYRKGE
jgi:hypothetical protein